jgi:hypothetical protein
MTRNCDTHCSMRCLHILLFFCVGACLCQAFGIRSPPPLNQRDVISASIGCTGFLDGWKWDRCVLDDTVVWTAVAFGHMQISTALGFQPPNFLGSHVQYAPFSLEQPFILSRDGLGNRSVRQQLPPLVFSLFIQSEVLESSFWSPIMTCEIDSAGDEDNGIGWSQVELLSQFRSNLTVVPQDTKHGFAVGQNVLRIVSNTEYVFDNVILHSFGPIFPSQLPLNQVHLLSIDAHIQLHEASSSQYQPLSDLAMTWSIQCAVAFDRRQTLPSISPPSAAPKRPFANLVSHKMCDESAMYPVNVPSQYYNARSRTLSVLFRASAGKVSMNVLSASVTHDMRGRAHAEFLVWFEADGECGDLHFFNTHCTSFQMPDMNLSCSVFGNVLPAQIETKYLSGKSRESVISCSFDSSLLRQPFSVDDHIVHVHLNGSLLNLRAVIPMCPLHRDRLVKRIVACSQPIYNADLLETRWPGILRSWVLYHASFPIFTLIAHFKITF